MNPIQLTERFLYYPDPKKEGGTAEVFQGVDLQNRGAKVAVKIFKDVLISKELADLVFERETKALSRLNHPSIVTWVDAGRDPDSGRRYFVSEWLDEELTEHLETHPTAGWDDFYTAYANPILQALKYAYEQGVIHRDVKPKNLMVDTAGVPRIVDFGIAAFHQTPQLGHTLVSFKSVPFSPPDEAGSIDDSSRDVWGFAASCVACFNGVDIKDYSTLEKELDKFDVPPDIDEVFAKGLARDPQERYVTILDFAADLESVQRGREASFAPFKKIRVFIPAGTLAKMKENYYPNANVQDLKQRIVNDLNEEVALRTKEPTNLSADETVGVPDIEMVSSEHQYIASLHDGTQAPLVIKGMISILPFYADKFREMAYRPSLRFSVDEPFDQDNGTEDLLRLISEIKDHTIRQEAEKEKRKEEEFFNTWRDILRLKTELVDSKSDALQYDSIVLVGRRAELTCRVTPEESLVGQKRAIHLPNGYQVRGEVEDISDRVVTVYFDEQPIDGIPESGILGADNAATKLSIQRQQGAIDAIKFGRNVGGQIRSALIHPNRVPDALSSEIKELAFPEMDSRKRIAVSKAVAANPILLVQGPPGTGKTQLIVELVYQLISMDFRCKVLLTSQTHVALDNVLERLFEIAPDIDAVRVGRVAQERQSDVIRSMMIDEIATQWIDRTSKTTGKFLDQWAKTHNIPVDEFQLGRAVSSHLVAAREISEIDTRLKQNETRIRSLEAAVNDARTDKEGSTVFEKKEALQQLKEEDEDAKRRRREAQRRSEITAKQLRELGKDGESLVNSNLDELEEWERILLGADEKRQQFRRLLDLAEEWQLRFSNSKELYPAILSNAQVVAGTCIGFAGAKGILDVEFDVCIVDEASKATASEICVPLSRASRGILVGDQKQLPPFIEDGLLHKQRLDRYNLRREQVEETLFERLYQRLPESHTTLLNRQYRMLPQIGDLISHCFYDDKLESEPRAARLDLTLGGIPKPVTWVSTSKLKDRREQSSYPGFKNVLEAELIRNMLKPLDLCLSSAQEPWSVALLTGYVAQKEELKRQANMVLSDTSHLHLKCETVDSFQGRQADVAIFSVTRSNPDEKSGFLTEIRRLNVALSRGREALVIVGDLEFVLSLDAKNPLRTVADYVRDHPESCSIREIEQ